MKLRLFKSLVSVMLVALVSNAWAVDLIDAFKAAEKNDPTFRAARADYLSSKEATAQARSALLPQLRLSGLLENQNQNVGSNGEEFTISASQVIFDWGAFMQIRQARAEVRAAAALYAAEAQDLISRVSQAYFRVVRAQEVYKASIDLEKNAKINLDATRDRFKHGHATVTDIDQALSSYDRAKANAWKSKIEEYTTLQELSQITGEEYTSVATLKFSFPLITPDPKNINHWVNKAKEGNLFLKSSEEAVEAAKRAISTRRGDYIPVLRAFGSYQPEGVNVNNNIVNQGFQEFNYGLQVDYDAFEGGITLSQVRQAEADYSKAIAERERAYLSAVAEARASYIGVVVGIVQLRASRRSVVSSRNALENTRRSYLAGVKTILDILTQQEVLFEAQRDYALDSESYLASVIRLEQAAGILSPVTLVGINQWLDTKRKTPAIKDPYLSDLLKPAKILKKHTQPVLAGSEAELPTIAQTQTNLLALPAPKALRRPVPKAVTVKAFPNSKKMYSAVLPAPKTSLRKQSVSLKRMYSASLPAPRSVESHANEVKAASLPAPSGTRK